MGTAKSEGRSSRGAVWRGGGGLRIFQSVSVIADKTDKTKKEKNPDTAQKLKYIILVIINGIFKGLPL